mmetsp:Transcript_26495/g.25364  ORF Transcript_26495/g.25364 Transcript_26495/m.25364 type:complete len:797 (+) Transcript_26495:85-2475(+)|eukprot:CAMPEP_0119042902 /NCGR_PEP_ID=MMETSP1177-20130426/16259_1 /TAXON_ID=2985 /ORGANISM="Ochromonas sp, Strain CCMP1899" /LENGTH=796 /DNA_ID=CAMNT_0007010005 /DNA_START=37 /DNA_END=2427 /DNA_ORIENTATION=-
MAAAPVTFETESQKFFSFFCPLTYDVMSDPVMASDSITYERAAITEWINIHKQKSDLETLKEDDNAYESAECVINSPITGDPMTELLHPNIALREVLGELRSHLEADSRGRVPNVRAAFLNANMDVIPEISGLTRALSSEVFEGLDTLMHLDLMAKLKLQAPQVVVIGSENHGKSTLLERLIGFPIFPRNRTLCTRCPIRVKLRRHTASISSICIRNRRTNVIEEGSLAPLALGMMSSHVQALMDQMLQGQPARTIIGDREIVIEIKVPYCPNLDILDMPGLVAAPQEAADISLQLTRSIIEQEAAHSIFLLVVDCRTECTASIATRLVLDHKIEDQTIGIFTKMDIFSNEYEDADESKQDLFLSYMDPGNAGYVNLPKGWFGCASLPNSKLEGKPMERLLIMEKKERAMLRLDYGSLFDQKKVGMIAIRDGVQNEFENFLCNGWVEKIKKHLIECFLELSDQNANLGLPMPPSDVYKQPLNHLIALLPTVFPAYDRSMWEVTEEKEFKAILLDRVKTVCCNCQWMHFQDWSFWGVVDDLNNQTRSLTNEWKKMQTNRQGSHETMSFDSCIMEANKAQNVVHEYLNRLIEELGKDSHGLLSTQFMNALLGKDEPKKSSNRNVFEKALSFMLSSFQVEELPAVCKLERFPLFIESFQAHVTTQISIAAENFQAKAKKYVSDLPDVVKVEYRRNGGDGTVVGSIEWNGEYKIYYNSIITMFLKEILSLPELTQIWELSGSYLEENCVSERIDLLKQMTDIANGLSALQNFIVRIEKNQQDLRDNTKNTSEGINDDCFT